MQRSGLISKIKNLVVPQGKQPRTVRGGILRGIRLPIDLRHDFQLYCGTWERETYGWIRRLTRGVNTFVDIGASTGPITLYALFKTDAEQVLAIEPRTELHNELRRSLRLNGIENTDRLQIYSFFVGKGDSDEVEPLDALMKKVDYPCFIKCDVDGPEVKVLQGGKRILSKGDARVLVETHSKKAEKNCVEFLKSINYSVKIIDNAWWRAIIPEQRPIDHNRWLVAYNKRRVSCYG